MKVVTVVGARPQFIKAASLSRALSSVEEIREVIIHTGQHFDKNMSDVFFDEMSIPKPDYNLAIHSMSHGAMTGRMVEAIESVLEKEKPDLLLVYGDTNSTLAGALAAVKMHIPIAHVEAGLRSFNMKMPEEVNRILTDRVSDILFCPTHEAVMNLKREGFDEHGRKSILQFGDVMEDAAKYYESQANDDILKAQKLNHNDYYLCTIHRAENTDSSDRFKEIILGLNELSKRYKVILPVHPRTKVLLNSCELNKGIVVIDPVGYMDMISLLKNARLVITDSGGLQKEAYFFEKFCVTVRDQTEWTELVENGYNRLVGANSEQLLEVVEFFESRKFIKKEELYGGGRATSMMVEHIKEWLFSKD